MNTPKPGPPPKPKPPAQAMVDVGTSAGISGAAIDSLLDKINENLDQPTKPAVTENVLKRGLAVKKPFELQPHLTAKPFRGNSALLELRKNLKQ